MREVDPRAQFQVARADSGKADPGGVDHPLAAFVCRSQDRWAEPGRWSGLQGLWLELKGLGGSLQPEVPESPLSRSIRLVVLAAEGQSLASAFRLATSLSWRCSRLQY